MMDQQQSLTPMMRQYTALKETCPDAILFFRMGDFYEIFETDAQIAAPLLDIVLTSREKGDNQKAPFCGVPHHSAKNYWMKLLRHGYKVAIAEQVETPAEAKGIVKRQITKVISPGCIDDMDGLERDSPNYLMGFYEQPLSQKSAICLVDISTGEIRVGSLSSREELLRFVGLFRPRELLVRKFETQRITELLGEYIKKDPLLISSLPEGILRDPKEISLLLKEVFGVSHLKEKHESFGEEASHLTSALLHYLKNIHIPLSSFKTIRPLIEEERFCLYENVVCDLELFETARSRKTKGSLFSVINQTCTPMGARLLRFNLLRPFQSKERILKRHKQVEQLLALKEETLKALRQFFAQIADIQRLATRIAGKRITAEELSLLYKSLGHIERLSFDPLFKGLLDELKTKLANTQKLRDLLQSCLLEEGVLSLGLGHGIFKKGYDEILDNNLSLSAEGNHRVEDYQEKLKQETGISSLKIKPHKTFGLLIEITKSNLNKVPDYFIRRQTMVNNERFVTEELRELDDALSSCVEVSIQREAFLFDQLLENMQNFQVHLCELADQIADLDLVQSFAWLALKQHYVLPEIVDGRDLFLEKARHPVVEVMVGDHRFAPNDIELDMSSRCVLITGPNMGGKSTFMRQIAICALLSQIGSFVPAKKAVMPLFDQIYTRVGASDDLSQGLSTFMVEMSESAFILKRATAKSLIILDEVGRGTSTEDGLAIAKAIFSYLAKHIGPVCFFATHFHQMVKFCEQLPFVKLMQTQVVEKNGKICFTHKMIPGASGSSYGIEVADLAGLPKQVLEDAKFYLQESSSNETQPRLLNFSKEPSAAELLALEEPKEIKRENPFSDQVIEAIRSVNINRITPMKAINMLADFQEILSFAKRKQSDLFEYLDA